MSNLHAALSRPAGRLPHPERSLIAGCHHPTLDIASFHAVIPSPSRAGRRLRASASRFPVARVDAVRVPEYRRDTFLVYSSNSLERARFIPPDAEYGKVVAAIQRATGRVAAGEAPPVEAAARYAEELAQTLGADRVITAV